jgi:hypothetical protein
MEDLELVLIPARARKFPEQMYVVGVAVAGTEKGPNAQMLFYSNGANIAFIKTLIKEHNDLVKEKNAKKKK